MMPDPEKSVEGIAKWVVSGYCQGGVSKKLDGIAYDLLKDIVLALSVERHKKEDAVEDAAHREMELFTARKTIDIAWGLIANAGGGDWTKESKEWQEAATRWRDKRFERTVNVEGCGHCKCRCEYCVKVECSG